MAVDLPAFERPAKAISGTPAAGNCAAAAAPVTNTAPTSGCGVGNAVSPEAAALDARFESVTMVRLFTALEAVKGGDYTMKRRSCCHGRHDRRSRRWRSSRRRAVVAADRCAPNPTLRMPSRLPRPFAPLAMAPTETARCRPTPTWPGRARSISPGNCSNSRRESRTNPVMSAMVGNLAPDDMVALGIYFSRQKPKGGSATDPVARQGRTVARTAAARRPPVSRRARHAIRPTARASRRTIRASPASTPTTRTRSSRPSRPASAAPTRTARTRRARSCRRSRKR